MAEPSPRSTRPVPFGYTTKLPFRAEHVRFLAATMVRTGLCLRRERATSGLALLDKDQIQERLKCFRCADLMLPFV